MSDSTEVNAREIGDLELMDSVLVDALTGLAEAAGSHADIVNIGTVGSTLTVAGALNVDEAATFDGAITVASASTFTTGAVLGTLGVTTTATFGGQMTGYHRLATGDIRGMTIEEKTDAETDTGFTLTAGKLSNSLYDGGAAAAITVPALTAGDVCAFRFAAAADGGSNIVFTLNSAQTFNAESLPLRAALPTSGSSGPYIAPEATVANGAGTGTVAFGATTNTITIATTATDNQTNVGSYLVFCGTGGNKVSFGFKPVTTGSGAVNATFTVTAA